MAFELATGDFLFDPKQTSQFCRDEDHLAHIIELLGDIPLDLINKGRHSKRLFNKKGKFDFNFTLPFKNDFKNYHNYD